jgi:hypothetical protein
VLCPDDECNLDEDEFCTYISSWTAEGCMADCSEADLSDTVEMVDDCTECLANDTCEEMLSDDDDGPPECFDDCVYEPTDNSTGSEICEFIGGDISCADDCIGDDAIPTELIEICIACLSMGNCDEVVDDYDDYDDDDDSDDPPE